MASDSRFARTLPRGRVLPEAGRSESGYRLFAADAVAPARLVRTLRELGVGLEDVKRVLAAEVSLAEVATAHASAIDAQIRTLRLRRAVLRAVARSTEPKELELMTHLTKLTVEERRRILDDYLDAVFDGEPNPVADRLRLGAPELPDDPSAEQVAAWVELVELLRDPRYIEASRRMVGPGRIEAAEPDGVRLSAEALSEQAGAAVHAGIDPASKEALAVIERVEASTPDAGHRTPDAGRRTPDAGDRIALAERIEAFTDRRVFRYWELVGIINGWPNARRAANAGRADAWEWYAQALRMHA
jgi:DNA-binding transcriptional MerR regulator